MKLLKSNHSTLIVLALALLAQIPHAAYVFSHTGKQADNWFNFLHGYAYAIALEATVLLFVVRNRQFESYGFATVSILINLCYYWMHELSLFQFQAFPGWLVSVALPVAIACYSHDIAHETVAPGLRIVDSIVAPEQKHIATSETPAQQRRATLKQWLDSGVSIVVSEVAEQFKVSQQLIRREIKELRTP